MGKGMWKEMNWVWSLDLSLDREEEDIQHPCGDVGQIPRFCHISTSSSLLVVRVVAGWVVDLGGGVSSHGGPFSGG